MCGSCKADIRWVKTAASMGTKSMPLDAEPNDDGNVELVWSESRGQLEAVVHGQPPLIPPDVLYMPHFVTCPNWNLEETP